MNEHYIFSLFFVFPKLYTLHTHRKANIIWDHIHITFLPIFLCGFFLFHNCVVRVQFRMIYCSANTLIPICGHWIKPIQGCRRRRLCCRNKHYSVLVGEAPPNLWLLDHVCKWTIAQSCAYSQLKVINATESAYSSVVAGRGSAVAKRSTIAPNNSFVAASALEYHCHDWRHGCCFTYLLTIKDNTAKWYKYQQYRDNS